MKTSGDREVKKLMGGIYERDGMTIVVSRGLGNSLFPFRFMNYPELVLITLKSADS